ncbi:MAG: TolC family protein [Bacteroidetes bacterium]|nr:TolC family protein [Bacteroidota bacterium]
MTKFSKYRLIFYSILFLSVELFAQHLTLNEAIEISLSRNEKIKMYQAKLSQKEYDNLSAWGNFLPVIDIEARYTHLNKDLQIDLNPIRDAMINIQAGNQVELTNISNVLQGLSPLTDAQRLQVFGTAYSSYDGLLPQFVETFKKQDYKTSTLTAIQPLFLGGKLLAAKKYASTELRAAENELTKIKNEVASEVISSYMQVLVLQKIVSTRNDVLNGMLQHKINADKLYDQGIIPKYHLLRAEVAVAEAERNLSTDKNNLELAQIVFANLLGSDNYKDIYLSDSLLFKHSSDPIEMFLSKAESNQPILKILQEKRNSAAQNYNVAVSSFLPQVAAFGKYDMYPEYLSSLEPRWAVGVQAKFNLFNGIKDYHNLQKAKELENEVDYLSADTKRKIDLWINKSYRDMSNNSTEFLKLDVNIELAKENYRTNESRFNSGLSTSLEVIDAQLSYEKIKIDRLLTLYKYYNALNDLYLASGSLTEFLNIWNQ